MHTQVFIGHLLVFDAGESIGKYREWLRIQ